MGVQEVFVPESVEEIGDWAFASCKELRRVSLPRRDIRLGRGVFKGCERLECIELRNACMSEETGKAGKENKEEQADGTGYLLAAADRLLHNPYLFDIGAAGTAEWHRKWDASLQELMHMPEDEGFSKMLLCGEEDYGSRENNIDHYCAGQRKRKARAALLRLRHDTFLSGELRGNWRLFCGRMPWGVRRRTRGKHLSRNTAATGAITICLSGRAAFMKKTAGSALRRLMSPIPR